MKNIETYLDENTHKRITSLSKYGDRLFSDKRYEDAVEKYKEALGLLSKPYQQWESATWLFVAIGDVRFKQQNFKKAQLSFENAVQCMGGLGNPFIHLRLGQCYYELGDKDKAADELVRAFMGAGKDIFVEDDNKYFNYIKDRIE